MVDLDKKKGDSGNDKSKKSKSSGGQSKSRSSGSGRSSGGSSPEPFSMEEDFAADFDEGTVASTSKRWASEGAELNYHAENGESERQYVKRQIKECREFYENYVDTALDNMKDINQFTMIHHALGLSMARNRSGIMDVLMDEYGYSEDKAADKTDKIVTKAGEKEAFREICNELTREIRED